MDKVHMHSNSEGYTLSPEPVLFYNSALAQNNGKPNKVFSLIVSKISLIF
jgi:hypothetical protein